MGKVIQMIPFTGADGTPDMLCVTQVRFDSAVDGRIRFYGKPIKLFRDEHFSIEGETVTTEQFNFPVAFLSKFLFGNDCIDGDGVIIKNIWEE